MQLWRVKTLPNGSLYPTLFPGEGAEAFEGGSSGHVGETSPLQLGHRWLKRHTHPVSCKHRPNHSPSAEKQGSRAIHVHFMYSFVTWLKLCVCVSWRNSFTFCDSFKSLSVQRRSPLPRVHTESNYRKGQCLLPASTSSPPKQNKYCTIWGTIMVVMTHKWILAPEGLFWRAKSVSEWSRFTFVYIGNVQTEIKPHLAKNIFIITLRNVRRSSEDCQIKKDGFQNNFGYHPTSVKSNQIYSKLMLAGDGDSFTVVRSLSHSLSVQTAALRHLIESASIRPCVAMNRPCVTYLGISYKPCKVWRESEYEE